MSSHRFILEKGSRKYDCRRCGGSVTFRRYVDTENGNQYLADDVGICDRLNKCGYHYPPKQYFADNPEVKTEFFARENKPNKKF
jgi:hypothetical protein